jgi:acetylornithine deacetylase/succinyl-diaminopimelate desuccinylase-like protein
MMYGHLDKQPYEEPWEEGLGPITPVIRDGKLYGRGGADDGYASFSAMLAVKNAQLQGVKLPRIVLVLETEEESGSDFLISLLKVAEDFIQKPDVLICLDSGCLDYEQMWLTSSLRGVAMVDMQVTHSGSHAGSASGVVPDTFSIVRMLLDRIDDEETGLVHEDIQNPIPEWKIKEAENLAALKGRELCEKLTVL